MNLTILFETKNRSYRRRNGGENAMWKGKERIPQRFAECSERITRRYGAKPSDDLVMLNGAVYIIGDWPATAKDSIMEEHSSASRVYCIWNRVFDPTVRIVYWERSAVGRWCSRSSGVWNYRYCLFL